MNRKNYISPSISILRSTEDSDLMAASVVGDDVYENETSDTSSPALSKKHPIWDVWMNND